MDEYPCSGEINRKIDDAPGVLAALKSNYLDNAQQVDLSDGLSMSFDGWRFNLRSSNTEPVVRLNVEATNQKVMEEKTEELLAQLL
jgi:phosphomannomutase